MDRALDLRLQELRARALHVDPLLARLVDVCTRSGAEIQVGLVCVLGATVVRGVPVATTVSGDALDAEVRFFLDVLRQQATAAAADEPFDDLARLASTFDLFGAMARDEVERRAAIVTRLADVQVNFANLAEVPEALQQDALELSLPPKAVTLAYAQVRYADGLWEDVGTLRVLLPQVHAWWPFRLGAPEDVASE